MVGVGESPDTAGGAGRCKGTALLTFPTACPPRDAFTELPEGLKKKKMQGKESHQRTDLERNDFVLFFLIPGGDRLKKNQGYVPKPPKGHRKASL